ncbi:MAG: amino acid permease [Terriglobia bacterium]|nr:amino acid permease [Terriglobia bacterium]
MGSGRGYSAMAVKQKGSRPDLIRGLGVSAAAAIVMGTMIGTGIFLKPSEMANQAGVIGIVFAAWIVGGILSLFGGLCYAELGASIPEAGGEYSYLRRGFGPVWGFLFGWMHSVVARPASVAAIAAGLARFCAFLFPVLATPLYVIHGQMPFLNQPIQFAFTWMQPLSVVSLIVISYVNYLGIRAGGRLQVALTIVKVLSLLVIIVGGLMFLHRGEHMTHVEIGRLWPANLGWKEIGGFFGALAAAVWAYDGWNDLNLVGSEVEDPGRTFPRVIVTGMLMVIVLFLLFNYVCFTALPFSSIQTSRDVASDVFSSFAGKAAGLWITVIMAISALGTLNSSALSGARVDYAMARDGLFFRFAGAVHPKYRSPGNALIFQCCMASLMALSGTFEDLTSLVMFGSWIFYGFAVAAMIRMRITEPDLPRPFRTWGYPLVPVLFIAGAFALAVSMWLNRPIRSSIGLVLILCGLFFYRSWRTRAAQGSAEFSK